MVLREAYSRDARRKWLRRAGAVAAILSLISAALFLRVVYLAVTAKRGSAIDYGQQVYELAAQRQGASPADPNGFDALQAAYASWQGIVAELEAKYGPDAPNGDLTPRDFAWPVDPTAAYIEEASDLAVARAREGIELARARGVFAEIDAGLSHAWVAPPPAATRPLFDRMQTHLGAWRNLARVLMANAAIHLADGNPQEAIICWERQLRLAEVASRQETMIGHLVGLVIAAQAVDQIRFAAVEGRLPPTDLRRCLETLGGVHLDDFANALAADRLQTLDMLQWMHTDDGKGSGRRMVREWGEPSSDLVNQYTVLENAGGLRLPRKHEVVARMDEFYAGAMKLAALPRYQRSPAIFDADAFCAQQTSGYEFLARLAEHYSKPQRASDRIRLDLTGVHTVLAIELFRTEADRLPESLEEIAPLLDGHAPIDTFTTGHPFIYKRAHQLDGRDYLLYAVGADGIDNGGTLPAGHPAEALDPDMAPGADFVFNRKRESRAD